MTSHEGRRRTEMMTRMKNKKRQLDNMWNDINKNTLELNNKPIWAGSQHVSSDVSNQDILKIQQDMFVAQDKSLDQLSASIARQKLMAHQIGEQADEGSYLLDSLNKQSDNSQAKIEQQTDFAEYLTADSSTKCYWITIVIEILVVILLTVASPSMF